MKGQIKISKNFSMEAIDYANQGNSIIGIRGSGKTYAAMQVAEQLLDNGIPIIAFDPTGVWQNLRNGINGHPGYPVVVAGGMFPDLPLNETNAVQIVEAALKAGVSLVIDLKGLSTSNKSSWMRIVSSCVEYLQGNNDQYGLRHVFIEEAAEFVPQRPNPGGQLVYSRIESLARMGRNFGLGYTLINQRAEEIAKAIFEISEQVMVFRQSGKNSLKSIQDWLNYRGLKDQNISDTLPRLDNGECWIINEKEEVRAKVLAKKTFHPDPKTSKTSLPAGTKTADRTGFIDQMKKAMEKPAPVKKDLQKNNLPAVIPVNNQASERRIKQLEEELKQCKGYLKMYVGVINGMGTISKDLNDILNTASLRKSISPVLKLVESVPEQTKIVSELPNHVPKTIQSISQKPVIVSSGNRTLGKCSREVLRFLAQYPDRQFTKAQVAIATNYSAGSGGFNNALSELNQKGYILRDGKLQVNPDAHAEIILCIGNIISQDYDISTYKNNLGKCEREIYEVLLAHPHDEIQKDQLATMTETQYSAGSGGFNNALSRLNTLELIERRNGMIKLNPELLELL
jgi:uncharacterized protein